MEQIRAPFTPQQVRALNRYQDAGFMHPFTCPNRGDGRHVEYDGKKRGLLVATPAGWACPDCDYTQDWAHAFMAESLPVVFFGFDRAQGADRTVIGVVDGKPPLQFLSVAEVRRFVGHYPAKEVLRVLRILAGREMLEEARRRSKGCLAGAARVLGVSYKQAQIMRGAPPKGGSD